MTVWVVKEWREDDGSAWASPGDKVGIAVFASQRTAIWVLEHRGFTSYDPEDDMLDLGKAPEECTLNADMYMDDTDGRHYVNITEKEVTE